MRYNEPKRVPFTVYEEEDSSRRHGLVVQGLQGHSESVLGPAVSEIFENGGHPGHPFGCVRRQDFGLPAALARAPRS